MQFLGNLTDLALIDGFDYLIVLEARAKLANRWNIVGQKHKILILSH